ncbi:hypothetical protein ACFOHT_04965 [Massilia oculi]|uniref:Uncharacterized protein n=1 Tax=Massilia oculi TaxID=945844 RepID=A0A2S2DEA1_9BURK|nr:hypothetical protein [Massilia oculi]AWL03419.1 hypothetical protein DIR46_02415 [Massilia oculi]
MAHKGFKRKSFNIKAEWDIAAVCGLYKKIARASLSHWLGGECECCHDTKVVGGSACTHCDGTGLEPIQGGAIEREKVLDMVATHQRNRSSRRCAMRGQLLLHGKMMLFSGIERDGAFGLEQEWAVQIIGAK